LGNESRLWLLRLVDEQPRTVSALTEVTGMAQPLVSQHLRTLRQVGLLVAERHGKEVTYALADQHASHVVKDALFHAQQPARIDDPGTAQRTEQAL
jgi:DNA-binding transcriptional ArsR family regulator